MNFKNSLLIVVSLLILVSCASSLPRTKVTSGIKKGSICKIAIIPFENETAYKLGGELVTKAFIAVLVKEGWQVTPEGDVRKILLQERIFPGEEPSLSFYSLIKERLDVDVVIKGRVVEMKMKMIERETIPVIALWIEGIDANTGKLLWSSYHRRQGDHYRKFLHFGVVRTMTELARRIAIETASQWKKKGLKCEEE